MYSRSDSKADFRVHEFRTLGRSRDADALAMLRQVAHQVQPIMRRREWTVPLLSEFFPAQTNLLGLNVGGGGGCTREVKVRLRPARDPDSFLPYESVLHTMLHELVHNVRAPHDKAFYKLLDEITAECEELMAKGVGGTGVGFDGPSCGRLGSHSFIPQHNPHPASLRDVALRAAEERVKRQRIMPIGPQRLGGGGTGTDQHYKTPAAAAAAAAERRCNDNRWCPCERVANALGRAVTAAQQKRAEFNQEQHAQQQSLLGSASGQGAASGGKGGPPGAGVGTSSSGRRQGLSRAAGLEAAGVVTGGAITAGAGGNTHSRGHSLSSSAEGDSGLDLAGVEADLVRGIEDGVVDFTLDSDSEPKCERDTPTDAGGNRQAAGGRGLADASTAGGSCSGQGNGIRFGRGSASGDTGAMQCGPDGKPAPSAAVGVAGVPGWRGPGPCRLPGPERRANHVVVVIHDSDEEEDPRDSGRGSAAATAAAAPARRWDGAGVKASNQQRASAASSGAPVNVNAMPSSRAGAAGPMAAPAIAPITAAQAQPPLRVMHPRTATASRAAAAALARLQQSVQQSANLHINTFEPAQAGADSKGGGPAQPAAHKQRSLQTNVVSNGATHGRNASAYTVQANATATAFTSPSSTGQGQWLSTAQPGTGAICIQQPVEQVQIIDLTEDS